LRTSTPLAKRPYDLRHAAVSTWLNGGVPPTDVARWAGQSVEVLFRIYAKCMDGGEEELRRRVQAALGHTTAGPKPASSLEKPSAQASGGLYPPA
jgi:hypothetical protein